MPIFLIPIIAVLAALGVIGGLTVVIPRLAKKLAGKNVAILGRQQVGKTTLLHVLKEQRVPTKGRRTVDPAQGGKFSMDLDGKSVGFHVPNDLPGNHALGYQDWKDAFTGADYVWYLFRSDLIAQGDPTEFKIVRDHFNMFKGWMDANKSLRPKIILIGTFADLDPRYRKAPGAFKRGSVLLARSRWGQSSSTTHASSSAAFSGAKMPLVW